MLKNHRLWCMMIKLMNNFTSIHTFDCIVCRARQAISPVDHCLFHSLLEHLRWKIHDDIVGSHRACQKNVLTQKSTHWNPRASVRQARKIDQACQSIWPVDWQGDRVNVKFEGVSAGVPIIPQIGVSASFADTECNKRIFKYKRVINECVGRISRCTRRQNRLWVADYACVTRSKLRMCNSDDVN